MNRLFSDRILKILFIILTLAAIAKAISSLFFLFLPKSGFEKPKEYKELLSFSSFQMRNVSNQPNISYGNSPNLKLLAVYKKAGENDGFVVISDGGEPQIIKKDGNFKQYKLKEIKQDKIYLENGSSGVWIEFAKSSLEPAKIQQQSVLSNVDRRRPFVRNATSANAAKEQVAEETTNRIARSDMEALLESPDTAFKAIGFREVMKDGKIDGFRVLGVNRNSPFSKLGIRTGDVIQSFNGVRLNSYASALEVYNNAGSLSKIKIELMRNNEKKEFEYEIY